MNDSEYLRAKEDKPKKRLSLQNKKITRRNNYEFYDRDAKYCSQVNIDLDCSSTDIIKNFKGDCKKNGKHVYNLKINNDEDVQPHDVWAVLRNINRFQFNPSPPMSEDSTALPKKKKKGSVKDRGFVFETCRTEQYAYISSIDVDSKSRSSFSQSTIIDRITVIDNESEINEACRKLQKKETKPRSPKSRHRGEKVVKNKTRKNNLRAICLTNNDANQGSIKTNSKPKTGCDNNDSLILSNVIRKSPSSDDLDGSLYNDDDCFRDSSCVTTDIGFITPSRSESKNCIPIQKDKDKPKTPLAPISYPKMCGTTRIVSPSKRPESALSKRLQSPVRKPRLVTTMPSSSQMPKLTQIEIRRRLATIKFPLIILGKDQVSSTIQVEPYDHPQFNGLDNHIWPFMLGWSKKEIIQVKPEDERSSAKTRYSSSSSKKTNYLFINKHAVKDKRNLSADKKPLIYKKKEANQTNVNNESKVESSEESKSKPIRQFRDKMLKLLYKKKSYQSVENSGQGDVSTNSTKKLKPGPRATNANENNKFEYIKPASFKQNINVAQVPLAPGKLLMPSKPLWGKAKWANDFVENVIKKIKAGTYYNNEIQEDSSRSEHHESKEVSIQTAASIQNTFDICGDLTPKITIQRKKETLGYLPGFDSDLPQLEVKSMTRNQISVKHCVTNVMFQFDVALPFESESIMGNIKRSMSCIPLSVTDSKTRIFKCKARIVNAMLPAEICTIIPKVISKLQNPDMKFALPPVQKDIVNACLSTISEMPTFEVPSSIKIPLLSHVKMTMELRLLANGQFLKKSKPSLRKPDYCKKKCGITTMEIQRAIELLPKPLINYHYFLETHPASPLHLNKLTVEKTVEPETINFCTDLVPLHTEKNLVSLCHPLINIQMISGSKSNSACTDIVPLLPGINSISLTQSLLNNFLKFVLPGLPTSMSASDSMRLPSFMLKIFRNNVILNFNVQEISNTVSINAKNYKIDSYNTLSNFMSLKSKTREPSSSLKCIEYIKNVDNEKTKGKKNQNDNASSNPIVPNKHRKRKFVRLYKKCKSTSHISAEKMCTPLNRITNLEEFFQALGASKLLSSVMDGYSGRKILASLIEMKSWITDITPRQALMVLLLANKKDTTNLVRFRPVILQGIAVNRITRASELDMEIEVIEREKFNKLTEASDYQKPFDETSEKLLKALLEKRKKLNPSYLRLMARYVGLGLLKSPVKSCRD
ncbi:hypothetical protein MSG28_012422 [Choristoneura fumiferana]|uniref:Uncharacterized protein n=1 Tax=Choristoneura fumiferana TaxID=7141 RepID=A0ACC0KD24_CHOFU|nr:hypothetical protein MSG28_012422 [Choristoneura fumiferana]